MAMACGSSVLAKSSFVGGRVSSKARSTPAAARSSFAVKAAARPLWAPGVEAPTYLDGTLPADYGWDPLGLGANPETLKWNIQAELVHARWAMLAVAGILVQEIIRPDVFWYEAALPKYLPNTTIGGSIGLPGLSAAEFLMMHWAEVRRYQDIRKHKSVDEDPLFKGNKVPNEVQGYPGGVFDPLGFSKGNFKELQTKELKNGRLAMIAFIGFTLQAQTTGKGPLASLAEHLGNPFASNIATNIGTCKIPSSVDIDGVVVPLICLWPGQH